jgi:hypothetical protein
MAAGGWGWGPGSVWSLTAQAVPGGGGLSPEHAAFLDFLTNRPPVREVVFELSGNRYVGYLPDGSMLDQSELWPFVPVRGSLQTETFFLDYPKSRLPELSPYVYGESADYYWAVTTNAVVLAPKEGPGAHPENGMEFLAKNARRDLEGLLMLGLEEVEPGTLSWLTPTSFEARSVDRWVRKPVPVQGQLYLDAAGRPLRLEYQAADPKTLHREVRYTYGEGGRLPRELVISGRGLPRFKDKQLRHLTNRIVRLETGMVERVKGRGFVPSMFIPEGDPHQRVLLVDSNGLQYRATELGLILDEGAEPPAWALAGRKPGKVQYFWWATLVVAAGGFVGWWGWRRRQAPTNPQKD